MIRLPVIMVLLPALVASCAPYLPRKKPLVEFQRDAAWKNAPAWAKSSLRQNWWEGFGDSQLNSHLATALSLNPGLTILGKRLTRSRTQSDQARAATWPTFSLGSGLLPGREQNRSTGYSPEDLQPWTSSGSLSWEVDLSGRIRASIRAAREAEKAAFWDLHAGRLLTATRVAEAHFRILRLNEERAIISDSVAANRKILEALRERAKAELISETSLLRQQAEHEKLTRNLLDLDRLRGLAHLQLETLCGGASLPVSATHLRTIRTPALPHRTTSEVLARRPDLLAAEARLRSAFELEESARLNLLPSLTLGAGTSGRSSSLLSDFRIWIASAGPLLDIPIYDPQRLATVASNRAATEESAAIYRRKALLAFEEVEGAYLNLVNRHHQLQVAQREVTALEKARRNTIATFDKGIISQIELFESERRSLEGRRQQLALRHALLKDHLTLIRALGGG